MAPKNKAKSPRKSAGKSAVKKPKSKSSAKRAGLVFPPGRMERYLRRRAVTRSGECSFPRVNKQATVYLAAALEYLTAEILELSGNEARADKRVRILPKHIQLAIRKDEELQKLVSKTVTLRSGGVNPLSRERLDEIQDSEKIYVRHEYELTASKAKKKILDKFAQDKAKKREEIREKRSKAIQNPRV